MEVAREIAQASLRVREARTWRASGVVSRVVGLAVESTGPPCSVGEECRIVDRDGTLLSRAQVVGFSDRRVFSMPTERLAGVRAGSRVVATGRIPTVGVSRRYLGRILDADGLALDSRRLPAPTTHYALDRTSPNALERDRIREPFVTGVRAIDALTSLGRGQRTGIFAGSGVGKSTLLGMIARHARADVVIVSLVGERGREVRDFVEDELGPSLTRSIVFVATSDEPPMRRVRAAQAALAAAEFFRDEGADVLLLMDSLTRVAMAQREIGLSLGEPPSTKGYPPSVFSLLPRLVERAGPVQDSGSITGIYTIYVEGDDLNDPVADAARSLLDGHIVLSRDLADQGHFPAIDVLASLSRLMSAVGDPEVLRLAEIMRRRLDAYREAEDAILLGAYREGSNPLVDEALRAKEPTRRFLVQARNDGTALEETRAALGAVVEAGDG